MPAESAPQLEEESPEELVVERKVELDENHPESKEADTEQAPEKLDDDTVEELVTDDLEEFLSKEPGVAENLESIAPISETSSVFHERVRRFAKDLIKPAVAMAMLQAAGSEGVRMFVAEGANAALGKAAATAVAVGMASGGKVYETYKEEKVAGTLRQAGSELLGAEEDPLRAASLLAKAPELIKEAHERKIPQSEIDEFTLDCRRARTLLKVKMQEGSLKKLDNEQMISALLQISRDSEGAIPRDADPEARALLGRTKIESDSRFNFRKGVEAALIGATTGTIAAGLGSLLGSAASGLEGASEGSLGGTARAVGNLAKRVRFAERIREHMTARVSEKIAERVESPLKLVTKRVLHTNET